MFYSIEEITSLIGAHRYGTADAQIGWLLTDSRSLIFPETTLFFAIQTSRNDGHKYIRQLYQRGVRNFVVKSLPENKDLYVGANFLKTMDPLKSLQRLAERHREEFSLPVIGITGSNGKTIVKEWLNQLLSSEMVITRSPRSYNSQIGVPLSVWLINEHSQMGIFEAGISQNGEMQALQTIIQPTIGLLTNIGKPHQENFESLSQKCKEKLRLFKECQILIYNEDEDVVRTCVDDCSYSFTRFAWSMSNPKAELYIPKIIKQNSSTEIHYIYKEKEQYLTIPFIDDASVENAIHCLAVCLFLQLDSDKLQQRMASLEPVAMRLEVKEGVRGCTLINDSYNSDLKSLEIALDFMNRRQNRDGRQQILFLSDILQSGVPAEELYQSVADLLQSYQIHRIIGVGPEISRYIDKFQMEHEVFSSTEELLASGLINCLQDVVILIKGAHSFRFDLLSEQLSLKVHETTLEVNLNALVANYNHYRNYLKPETKMVCMVKASAYGSGSIEVAKTLQDHQVDYLAVAVADEGVALRKGGIHSNIMIMNPEMTAFKDMFDYELEPEVYNFRLLKALVHAAEKEGITHFPIHVKIDTGMHRLGFNPDEVSELVAFLKSQSAVIPRSVFSHFVGSDGDDFNEFTQKQFAIFDKASSELQGAFLHKILRHICNTAGIERFPQYHLDMVRLGLGLYGIDPYNNQMLDQVSSLRTTILQIRNISAGETVGYSRKGILKRDSRIAALPIGYADGLDRHLGCGKAYCLVNGCKAYYVGNICMDVCMIDVTDIPCKEGDEAVIFGDELPVTTLSDILGTIPYEVLTSISERVKRVYYQD